MNKRFEPTVHKRRYTDDRWTHEKCLKLLANHFLIPKANGGVGEENCQY